MAKVKTIHRCQACGVTTPRWLGKCNECGEWGTLVEEFNDSHAPSATKLAPPPPDSPRPRPISLSEQTSTTRIETGVGELDRVLGGGLIEGSVTLIGGEPGMGKSTLALHALAQIAKSGATTLLVTAEESIAQVQDRARRLSAMSDNLYLVSESNAHYILSHANELKPAIIAIDSIQTMQNPDAPGIPGSVSQVRETANLFVQNAKTKNMTTLLIGHVTKEGTIAGPRVLEHLVDTVLSFEGDTHHGLRMLRAVKHRFGSTAELGLFEMTEAGLKAVPDASALFLSDRRPGASGSVVCPVIEGARPILVEAQSLVVETPAPMPRRTAQGIDSGRLALILAVLERHAKISTFGADVFVSIAGGVKTNDTGADLATAIAIASAARNIPIADDMVALGEVGLGGELRSVPQIDRRLNEAARLGFGVAIVPKSAPEVLGITLRRVETISEALAAAKLTQ